MTLTSTDTEAPDRRAVSELWYTRCPVPTASSIAISQGWLDDEFASDGITVASLRASGATSVRESHFDHTQADSFRQGGNIPPIWTRSRGNDLRLIGLSWAEQYQAIVTLPGSGIEGPEDLRGRRFGRTRHVNDKIDFWHASALRGLTYALRAGGLSLDDIQLVDVEETQPFVPAHDQSHRGSLFGAYTNRRLQAAEVVALIRGEVDAIYVAGGRGPDLEAFLGVERVFDIQAQAEPELRVSNIAPVALTVSGTLLDARPDLVARYVAASLRAAAWAKDHADETHRILAHEVGIPEEIAGASYTPEVHATLEFSLDDHLVAAIESQRDFLLEHGYIADSFDVREWIAAGPLAEARALLSSQA